MAQFHIDWHDEQLAQRVEVPRKRHEMPTSDRRERMPARTFVLLRHAHTRVRQIFFLFRLSMRPSTGEDPTW